MTIYQLLEKNSELLKKNNTPNPHFEAEILLSHVFKKPREFILTHPEFELKQSQVTRYALCVARRMKGEPIAYITGHKEFYGLDFFVNKNVLIPRPETEMMVEEIMKLGTWNMEHTTFIDVGTGSGCIIITLNKLLSCGYPQLRNARFFGIDISKSALAIARKNAKFHGVERCINFLYGDLLEPILKNPNLLNSAANNTNRGRVLRGETLPEQNAAGTPAGLCRSKNPKYFKYFNNPNYPIIITANLPYLTPAQVKNSPTIQYEPKLALTAGSDGLKYYRRLFKQIKRFRRLLPRFSAGSRGFSLTERLKPQKPELKLGRITPAKAIFTILCEIDPSQSIKIKQLVKKELPDAQTEIKKDLAGLDRLAVIYF